MLKVHFWDLDLGSWKEYSILFKSKRKTLAFRHRENCSLLSVRVKEGIILSIAGCVRDDISEAAWFGGQNSGPPNMSSP